MASNSTDVVLTVIGPDRTGLVRDLSNHLRRYSGSWLRSSMARLEGHFAGILVVRLDRKGAETLQAELAEALGGDLRVQIATGRGPEPVDDRRRFQLELTGHDRPGIVLRVAEVLSEHDVNVDRLETDVAPGSMSGTPTFRAEAELSAPPDVDLGAVRAALEEVAADLLVDIDLDA